MPPLCRVVRTGNARQMGQALGDAGLRNDGLVAVPPRQFKSLPHTDELRDNN